MVHQRIATSIQKLLWERERERERERESADSNPTTIVHKHTHEKLCNKTLQNFVKLRKWVSRYFCLMQYLDNRCFFPSPCKGFRV
jgi:hypothetical protein